MRAIKAGPMQRIRSEADTGGGDTSGATSLIDKNSDTLDRNIEILEDLITLLTAADTSGLQSDYLKYQFKRNLINTMLLDGTLADTGDSGDRTDDLVKLNADKTVMDNAKLAIAALADYHLAQTIADYNVEVGNVNALFPS